MNILKESLFSSSKSDIKTKTKRIRSNHSKTNNILEETNTLSEPLLSQTENDNFNNIELGTIDSDNDNDDDETKLNIRHIARSRNLKQQSTTVPVAHNGGSIVIVEKPILPQETIQAFAIRYRVPVCYFFLLLCLMKIFEFYFIFFRFLN